MKSWVVLLALLGESRDWSAVVSFYLSNHVVPEHLSAQTLPESNGDPETGLKNEEESLPVCFSSRECELGAAFIHMYTHAFTCFSMPWPPQGGVAG